jgi:hypothetical protein
MVIGSNQVMEKSNLTARFDNHDYDGDSLIALALHSEQARDDFKYAYVKNQIEFEHMDDLLIDYEHESIYSSYMLSKMAQENRVDTDEELDLFSRIFSIKDFSDEPGRVHNYPGIGKLTNIEAAINKSLLESMYIRDPDFVQKLGPIYILEEHGLLDKKGLTKLTNRFWNTVCKFNGSRDYKDSINFWDSIHEFDKFLLECSGSLSECSPSFELGDFVVDNPEINTFKEELISIEPFLAFHQNLVLFEKVSDEINKKPDNILNKVFKSGARLKSVQLLKAASNTGIPTDIYGKAFPANIKSSLLDGLTPEEYFTTGDSARLALAVRQEAIPKGGELQRKFFFATGILKLDPDTDDCGSQKYYPIEVKNNSHLALLNHRFHFVDGLGVMPIDITDKTLIGTKVNLRSPMTCKCPDYKICKTCFGEKRPESINLGSVIGAALSEGIIQSVLRTHHFGGAFIATEDKKLIQMLKKCTFKAPDTIYPEDDESLEYISSYLDSIYADTEMMMYKITDAPSGKRSIKIEMQDMPFNDDSVKQLNNIVSLIDKNRDAASVIDPSILYDKLELVIEQNGILSIYLELIISLLYYDEDGLLYRYTDKDIDNQIALKNIIEVLDPKLSLFYNFSNRVISKIYNHTPKGHIDHMYHDLLEIYH